MQIHFSNYVSYKWGLRAAACPSTKRLLSRGQRSHITDLDRLVVEYNLIFSIQKNLRGCWWFFRYGYSSPSEVTSIIYNQTDEVLIINPTRPVERVPNRKHFEVIVVYADDNKERADNVVSYLNKTLRELIDTKIYSDIRISKVGMVEWQHSTTKIIILYTFASNISLVYHSRRPLERAAAGLKLIGLLQIYIYICVHFYFSFSNRYILNKLRVKVIEDESCRHLQCSNCFKQEPHMTCPNWKHMGNICVRRKFSQTLQWFNATAVNRRTFVYNFDCAFNVWGIFNEL